MSLPVMLQRTIVMADAGTQWQAERVTKGVQVPADLIPSAHPTDDASILFGPNLMSGVFCHASCILGDCGCHDIPTQASGMYRCCGHMHLDVACQSCTLLRQCIGEEFHME